MTILARMMMRMIFASFVCIWFGIALFVLTLDVLTNVNDIIKLGGYGAMSSYALHRAPGILSTFLPVSVLLALLLALTELSYRNETASIWSAGISPLRIMFMLAPMGLSLGLLQFVISDRAMPWAAPSLRDWGIGDYGEKQLKIGAKDPIWMRAGPDILRAASASANATRLDGVILFKRDSRRLLEQQIFAKSATQSGAGWRLEDVVVYARDGLAPRKLASLDYKGDLKPAREGARSGDPEEMSIVGPWILHRQPRIRRPSGLGLPDLVA